jgi:hypothetical protein
MEVDNIAGLDTAHVVRIIFELIPTTEVWVAAIWIDRLAYCIFDRSSNVCIQDNSVRKWPPPRTTEVGYKPLSKAFVRTDPQRASCEEPVCRHSC